MEVRTPALTALFLMSVASSAMAASNTDMSVTGIIVPNACSPNLTGGGVIDHGKLTARDLNADELTQLPAQSVQLSIRCEGPTLFTLNTLDNRAGTSAIVDSLHGLGTTANNEKLGSVALALESPVADNTPVRMIVSLDGGTTWAAGNFLGHTVLTTVASASGGLVPIAIKDFDAEVKLFTLIARADGLTLTDEIPIDGHVTVQLRYL